jgi:predicted PurR-regulated permease PerM
MDTREPLRIPTRDVLRILALIFAFYITVRMLWIGHPVIFLFFLGVLFGLPLAQGADWLQKRRVPRGLGVALILTVFFGLLIGGGAFIAPILRSQSTELQQRLPEAMDKIDAWLGHRSNGVLGILFNASAPDSVHLTRDSASVDSLSAPQGGEILSPTRRTDEVTAGGNLRREITGQFRGAQHSFLRMLTSTFAVTGAFLLVLFIAAYIAVDPHLYHGGMLEMVPVARREHAAVTMARVATTLRRWLVTQLIAMAVIGGVTTVFLLVIRVKAAVPLGILAGVAKFIPIVGSIFAAVPAVAMAFVDSPHKALVVGIGYIVIQFLENHLLVPVLMKHGVNMPPAVTLGIQALMALMFGFLGLLVAVPLLAAVLTIVRMMNPKQMREMSEQVNARLVSHNEMLDPPFGES